MGNIVVEKSFEFAIEVVRTYQSLLAKQKEFALFGQFMRSGTSIGANIAEAQEAQSKADFISKMSIALKESKECSYWIKLLEATGYLQAQKAEKLKNECESLSKLLTSIIKSTKEGTKK